MMVLVDGELHCRVFFQAEDGIRDLTVTGVQTCALPISCSSEPNSLRGEAIAVCYFTRFQQRGTPSILVRRAGQTRGVTYQASGLGPGSGQCSWILTARLRDRKSTRLNSSHSQISYAVFCLKKKLATHTTIIPPS